MFQRCIKLLVSILLICRWYRAGCFAFTFSISQLGSIKLFKLTKPYAIPTKLRNNARNGGSLSFSVQNEESYLNEVETRLREIIRRKEHFELKNQTLIDTIDELVKQRSIARSEQKYEQADKIRDQIMGLDLCGDEQTYELLIKDIPFKEGGGSTWSVILSDSREKMDDELKNCHSDKEGNFSVIQLAHMALGLKVYASSLIARIGYNTEAIDYFQQELVNLGNQALYQLKNQGEILNGRKSADAAFWFALAGIVNEELFEELSLITVKELLRFGERASCRPQDILVMVERLSAAGIKGNSAKLVQHVSKNCLAEKEFQSDSQYMTSVDLHSTQSLLWIWRFSTKQKKLKTFQKNASRHWEKMQLKIGKENKKFIVNSEKLEKFKSQSDTITRQVYEWDNFFHDPTKPLIVDVGCGMGVSLLGLASLHSTIELDKNKESVQQLCDNMIDYTSCNFVGCDLSYLATEYANGIASRWGLGHKLRFCVDEAEHFVESILESYPGPVNLIMIQFPTPFRFQRSVADYSDFDPVEAAQNAEKVEKSEPASIGNGNSQLPSNAKDGFMVSSKLLKLASSALSDEGRVLIQSNCEDVAVYMRNLAYNECNLQYVELGKESSVQTLESYDNLPRRALDWIESGGERAIGLGWSKNALIPTKGATETEVACSKKGIPLHRCILQKKKVQ